MLIEFSVGNYRSFKDKKTLSLTAAAINDFKEDNTIAMGGNTLLKGAVIYGANASGKSNFIKAMSTMRRLVFYPFLGISTSPCILSPETKSKPSYFEILCLIEGIRYRYGFEVMSNIVVTEWLFEMKESKEEPLFIREKDDIKVMNIFEEGKNFEDKTGSNILFLTLIDQFNGPIAKKIMNWFNSFITISGLGHENYEFKFFDQKHKKILIDFYKKLDLNFENIAIENELTGDIEFEIHVDESAGTKKILNLSRPIYHVLNSGGVLIVDELSTGLHPLITLAITRLFNSRKNSHNAQLIFATHEINLLEYGKYRRDQIYFVERNKDGSSDLYSLVEFKENDQKDSKGEYFKDNYIAGRYGAIPTIKPTI